LSLKLSKTTIVHPSDVDAYRRIKQFKSTRAVHVMVGKA
jgi:hypothetical protein